MYRYYFSFLSGHGSYPQGTWLSGPCILISEKFRETGLGNCMFADCREEQESHPGRRPHGNLFFRFSLVPPPAPQIDMVSLDCGLSCNTRICAAS